jgi:glycerol kinase
MSILVVDVGTSGLRAALVGPDGSITHERYRQALPETPFPGLVEFDGAAMAAAALELATEVHAAAGPGGVEAVGIANQRASTLVWDRATGELLAPGLGWQDLRTVGECLALAADGFRIAPNLSATKLAALLDQVDPQRERAAAGELCFGTVDSWIVWTLSNGAAHVTDPSNAAFTGLLTSEGVGWNGPLLERLRIPEAVLPEVVDNSGAFADAAALAGSPPICGMAGDQQASLIGQGCVEVGPAKITFGTGGMLDTLVADRPGFATRGKGGTYPIIGWRRGGETVWGIEAVMLSAGTNVEWLRDDLGLIDTAEASHDVASQVDTAEGVLYVPALLGLGTPVWDYGARGTLVGLTRGTDRRHIVRAVLEGVAHRGADLVEAAETDAEHPIESLRVDGGMSRNPTFVQALADATQRPVEVSRAVEATTLGAAFLAGLATGTWGSWSDVAATWQPQARVEPGAPLDRESWRRAVERARGWYPELSGIDF